MSKSGSQHQKSGKASFHDIYNMEDPRPYFAELGELDYETPDHGRRVFSELIRNRDRTGKVASDPTKVLDVCCSYGINGALLKHDLTLNDLYDRYRSEEMADLTSEELVVSDAEFYSGRRREGAPEVVGVDIAENAVLYGVETGMLDAGFAENLEAEDLTPELRGSLCGAELITVTGGIGYVSEKTFDRILGGLEAESEEKPWVACFALRWVSYDRYAELLESYGLVTEKLAGHTFPQRSFADEKEREYVLGELAKMGLDTDGKEAEGVYHADFYLSRPLEDTETPVGELLKKVTSG
ncbi:hypothetical protein [Rubrobacter indicoceani]|uniref:hypothetical protein n=1 Tax=Rubrobacter indicoceani TaxID=2051957 RepID=UPI000E5B0A5F|nr:hypothetical protein [Rubrobacter indicoceani]